MGNNYKLYSILGLDNNASQDEIKKAYRKLAFEYHPDKNKGNESAEAKFKEISNAYDILSNDEKKRNYDERGDDNFNNGNSGTQPNPHDIFEAFFRGHGGGPFGGHFDNSGFDDNIFNFMGGMRRGQGPQKCGSIEKTISLTLDEVYEGVNKNMLITIRKFCHSCNQNCNKCDGKGMMQQVRNMGFFQQIFTGPCDACEGSGIVIKGSPSCKECNGNGVYTKDQNATLIIPAGVDESYKSVFPDMGEQPKTSAQKPGDLFLNIKIEDHKHFIRKGNDLHYKCDISFIDSIIGTDICIPYFKEDININTKIFGVLAYHKKYLIEGKGLPILNTSKKGNMYIEFNISYPKIKNNGKINDLKKLLQEVFI
jgi:molecular chaperone DnaJ